MERCGRLPPYIVAAYSRTVESMLGYRGVVLRCCKRLALGCPEALRYFNDLAPSGHPTAGGVKLTATVTAVLQ